MMERSAAVPLYRHTNLQLLFGVTLIAVMGVSSITPAFPRIARSLNVSPEQVGLLITAFTLPGVFLTPVLGVLADSIGRKRILVPSLFVFAVAGTACAFVRDFDTLFILRLLQGIGAASLGSLNITIIGDIYSGHDRARAMGYNASVLSVGTASYPVIGGVLAALGWYFPFFLPSFGLVIGFLVLFLLRNPEPKREYSLRTYLRGAWQSVRQREVIGIFFMFLATFVILYGPYLSYMPFLIGDRFHGSSLIIGVMFSVGSISTAITSSQLGNLRDRFQPRTLLMTAYFLYLAAMLIIPLVPELVFLPFPVILFGVAQGLNIPNLQSLLAGLAPMEQRAVIIALNGMVLRLGQTLGPVIMAVVFVLLGLKATFFAGAAVAVVMSGIAVTLLRKVFGVRSQLFTIDISC